MEKRILGMGFLGMASVCAGAYHGYCDVQGIPFQKEGLEWALTYGPAIVEGGIVATCGGLSGLILSRDTRKTAGRIMLGAGVGGAIGGVVGGTQTLVGYMIGCLAGCILK